MLVEWIIVKGRDNYYNLNLKSCDNLLHLLIQEKCEFPALNNYEIFTHYEKSLQFKLHSIVIKVILDK